MDLCDEVLCSASLCDLSERVRKDESAITNFIDADPLQLSMQKDDILQAPDENRCIFADYSVRHDDYFDDHVICILVVGYLFPFINFGIKLLHFFCLLFMLRSLAG